MSLKKTLILALILIAGFFYISKVELPKDQTKIQNELLFGGIERKDFNRIVVKNGLGSFELVRSGKTEQNSNPLILESDWELADPKGAAVEPSRVNTIISALEQIKKDSSIKKEELEPDLSVYGLKEAELTVEVHYQDSRSKDQQQKSQLIKLGKKNDYVSKRYASFEPLNDLFLIPDMLHSAANFSADDMRNRSPVSVMQEQVSALKIESSEKNFEFALNNSNESEWQVVKPLSAKASREAIMEAITAIKNLHVDEFIGQQESKQHFEQFGNNPDFSVTLTYAEHHKRSPISVKFWPKPQADSKNQAQQGSSEVRSWFFASSEAPFLYSTNNNPRSLLLKDIAHYREKKLFQFNSGDLTQLLIEPSAADAIKVLRNSKDSSSWTVNDKEADLTFVNQLIENLAQIEAHSFPELKPEYSKKEQTDLARVYGFDKPRLKISVTLQETSDVEQDPKAKSTTERTLLVGDQVKTDKQGSSVMYYAALAEKLEDPFIISEQSFKNANPSLESLLKLETPSISASPEATVASQ